MDYQTLAVRAFMEKAEQEIPTKPKIPCINARRLRARLILEEAFEIINHGLGLNVIPAFVNEPGDKDERGNAFYFTPSKRPNLVKLADGCADLKVVIVGSELAFGIDGEPVFNEVMRSNMTKFADGKKDGGGKWIKGPNYSPANIAQIIEAQSKCS